MDVSRSFIDQSRTLLTHSYLPRIERCVERLPDDALWWRANEGSNSVGNLMLHLAGNLRQWIVTGLGRSPYQRDRPGEFAASDPLPREVLLHTLRTAVHEADHVLARLEPQRLTERHLIQGHECHGLDAIYHVVEHFAMHTGQIIFFTKQRVGDLQFYEATNHSFREKWKD